VALSVRVIVVFSNEATVVIGDALSCRCTRHRASVTSLAVPRIAKRARRCGGYGALEASLPVVAATAFTGTARFGLGVELKPPPLHAEMMLVSETMMAVRSIGLS
jgi:hypothetical protein